MSPHFKETIVSSPVFSLSNHRLNRTLGVQPPDLLVRTSLVPIYPLPPPRSSLKDRPPYPLDSTCLFLLEFLVIRELPYSFYSFLRLCTVPHTPNLLGLPSDRKQGPETCLYGNVRSLLRHYRNIRIGGICGTF